MVKLLLACLVVGLLMSALGIEAGDLIGMLGAGAITLFERGVEFGAWGLRYVILGAAIVVPVWLLVLAVSWIRRR